MPNPSAPLDFHVSDEKAERWVRFQVAEDAPDATIALCVRHALQQIAASYPDRRTYCTEPTCGERVTMDQHDRDLYGDYCDAHIHDRAYEARMTQGE